MTRLAGYSPRFDAGRLLNRGRLSNYSSRLLPLGFRITLLVGRALGCGDFVEGAPLRLQPTPADIY